MKNSAFPFLLLSFIFIWSCKPNPSAVERTNEKGEIQAMIEIPAGTNLKLEFSKEEQRIVPDQKDGKDRVVDFLPYPANYGFIPGTMMKTSEGGDGDPLDIFVISAQVPSGTVMAIKPIGVLNVKDNGALDTKVIAVPLDPALQVMKVENFSDFITDYYMAQQILQTWVLGYKGLGATELLGWEDEIAANKLIEKFAD